MKKKNLFKRIVSSAIAMLLAFTMLVPVAGAEGGEGGIELSQTVADVFNTVQPAGFDEMIDPYGLAGTDNTLPLWVQEELLISDNNHSSINFYVSDGLDTEQFRENASGIKSQDALQIDSSQNACDTVEIETKGTYTQCTSFDSDGDGMRESVAYVGWAGSWPDWSYVHVWYYNTISRTFSSAICPGSGPKATDYINYTYRGQSFFSITAGDFDGDGIETVVVGFNASNDGAYPIIVEFKAVNNETPGAPNTASAGYFEQLTHNDEYYQHYFPWNYIHGNLRKVNDYYDLLSIQLTAGDLNNDGIDDLAVLSYTNNITNSYKDDSSNDLYVPHLCIGYGSETSFPDAPSVYINVIRDLDHPDRQDGSQSYYKIPVAGSITCGDVNGDYREELIISGFYGELNRDGDGEWEVKNYSNDYFVTCIYGVSDSGALYNILYDTQEANGWTSTNDSTGIWFSGGGADYAWQTCGLATARLEGTTAPESIFINGSIFSLAYNDDGCYLNKDFTPDYFNSGDRGYGSSIINVTYIADCVSGNFSGSADGKEQFAFLVGLKKDSTSTEYFIPAYIGKLEIDEQSPSTTTYYCTDIEHSNAYGGGSRYRTHIAAIDNDGDCKYAKYSKKTYDWADPEVVGILQAAPYFGELGSYGDFDNGETTVSFSKSYEYGTGTSYSQNIGVGFHGEVEFEMINISLDIGYSNGYEKEVFNSTETSTSVAYSAGAYDTVILERTPVFVFYYDVWDPLLNNGEGGWLEDEFTVVVTQDPKFYQLTIDDYNDFADYYNAMLLANEATLQTEIGSSYSYEDSRFNKIEEGTLNLHQEGNPYGYYDGMLGNKKQTLSTAAGANSITYSEAFSSETTISTSHGLSFEVCTCLVISGNKAGIYVSGDFEWGSSTSTTVTTETETEASVAGLDIPELAAANDVSESVIRQYSFDWSFGTRSFNVTNNHTVPVYAYGVQNITSGHSRIKDLSVFKDVDDSLVLTWSAPEKPENLPIGGYRIYMAEDDPEGNYDLISGVITENTYTIPATDYPADKALYFKISTMAERSISGGGTYLSEGLKSQPVSYTPDDRGMSAYAIAVSQGFNGSVTDWLESLQGVSVVQVVLKSTSGNTKTYSILLSDGSSSDFEVENGANGNDGANGKSAYELALEDGFEGTLTEWLASIEGQTGVGIASIEHTKDEGLISYYTITFTDNTATQFTVANGAKGDKGDSGKSAYDLAVDAGFTGTLAEWLETLNGTDGSKVASVIKTSTEGLVDTYTITYTDGTSQTFEVTNGANGANGLNGKSAYELAVENGYEGTLTEWLASLKGNTGVSIVSVVRTSTIGLVDKYTITFSDGTSSQFTVVNGKNGKSAYELAVASGFKGTISEWLETLNGKDGKDGVSVVSIVKTSSDGLIDIYTITYSDSTVSTFTVTNGSNGADGMDGIDGINGADGKTAYELAVENGFEGTLTEWLASLKGATGVGIASIVKTSTDGLTAYYTITFTDGTSTQFTVVNGKDGKSAYELAVELGFTGTEEEWIESLKGKDAVGVSKVEKTKTEDKFDTYTIFFTDGSTYEFTVAHGNEGKSAYQLAVENGFEGSEAEWLASLKGATGVGIASVVCTSTDGLTTYYTITYTDGTTTQFTVVNGKDGKDGESGKSAYESAVELGFTGTEAEWVASLKGKDAAGVLKIEKSQTEGKYTIYFTDGSSYEFATSDAVGADTAAENAVTAETESTTAATTETDSGCGGSIDVVIVAIITALGTCTIAKKKH